MDQDYTLQYSAGAKTLGIAMPTFMLGGTTFAAVTHGINTQSDLISLLFLYGFSFLLLAYFYIEYFTVSIKVGPNGIEGTSGWRGKRSYKWPEIYEISYSPLSMWFKINAENKSPLRIHAWIDGIDIFQQHFIENLPEEKWAAAYEQYNG